MCQHNLIQQTPLISRINWQECSRPLFHFGLGLLPLPLTLLSTHLFVGYLKVNKHYHTPYYSFPQRVWSRFLLYYLQDYLRKIAYCFPSSLPTTFQVPQSLLTRLLYHIFQLLSSVFITFLEKFYISFLRYQI